MIGSTQETIPSNITLEKPEVIKIDNINKVVFSVEGYSDILKIYTAYQLYLDTKEDYNKLDKYYKTNISLYEARLIIKDKEIEILKNDREFVYKMLRKTRAENISIARRNKIKTILIASGSGLAGIGIGALVFLICNK